MRRPRSGTLSRGSKSSARARPARSASWTSAASAAASVSCSAAPSTGAAAPVACLLHRAGAGALRGDPQRSRRRGGCRRPTCGRAGVGPGSCRCRRPRSRDPRQGDVVRRERRNAPAFRGLPPCRRERPAGAGACCAGAAAIWAGPSPGTRRDLSPFSRESPFFGLPIPDEIGIRRQILAEPDSDLKPEDLGVRSSGWNAYRHRR